MEKVIQKFEPRVVVSPYDLTLWYMNPSNRFRENCRVILGHRIQATLYELLESLIEARYG